MCFIYEAVADKEPEIRPGWAELKFFPTEKIRRLKFGREHRDIIRLYERAHAGW